MSYLDELREDIRTLSGYTDRIELGDVAKLTVGPRSA